MKNTVLNYKLGADPELFLEKEGRIISAEGIIGGTKDAPKKISEEGHAIQEDNIMVEFNIPASETKQSFRDNINFVKDYLNQLVGILGCNLNFSASAVVDEEFLDTEQAKTFGCEPDFNVYTKSINDSPESTTNLRTCGGHIHIGYDEPSVEVSELIVYAMDAVLGLKSLELDKDDRRREMYGKAGCFRLKDYGVEYRTLSNFWIESDELINWAFINTIEALELVNSGEIKKIIKKHSKDIRTAIDTNDKDLAKKLLKKINKKEKVEV